MIKYEKRLRRGTTGTFEDFEEAADKVKTPCDQGGDLATVVLLKSRLCSSEVSHQRHSFLDCPDDFHMCGGVELLPGLREMILHFERSNV